MVCLLAIGWCLGTLQLSYSLSDNNDSLFLECLCQSCGFCWTSGFFLWIWNFETWLAECLCQQVQIKTLGFPGPKSCEHFAEKLTPCYSRMGGRNHEKGCLWIPPDSQGVFVPYNLPVLSRFAAVTNLSHEYDSMLSRLSISSDTLNIRVPNTEGSSPESKHGYLSEPHIHQLQDIKIWERGRVLGNHLPVICILYWQWEDHRTQWGMKWKCWRKKVIDECKMVWFWWIRLWFWWILMENRVKHIWEVWIYIKYFIWTFVFWGEKLLKCAKYSFS